MDHIEFEETRPYNDNEVPEAIKRIANNEYFPSIARYFFQDGDIEEFTKNFLKISTVDDFQLQVMLKIITHILTQTANKFSYSGVEQLNNKKNYMFISNHRDIVLDSAILQIILYNSGLKTSEITFGDNLMFGELAVDIGKINKMFKIVRGGSPREIFANSLKVSNYMRYAITEKHQSVWIAQRNGRTKDGNDETDVAVLKMFSMSSKKEFTDNLNELNITPIAVSYEYEPCDFLKTKELYISRSKKYVKEPNEDLNSIITGIQQWKGNIHTSICSTITKEELEHCNTLDINKFKELSTIIDQRIYKNYKLWKTNYIAHDLLNEKTNYYPQYSDSDKEKFVKYMTEGLNKIDGDKDELQKIFLKIYSSPLDNILRV
ncbi:1-acyl-sn-glycerol-3-phosphate acyltransferase [Bacteroidales bacterium OttesenSCG-928-I21]|nr:1-acyl-sn-glycerol-3-phosphate acyltransferase [Bacteroidales bacterium OttesenSCG-928-I21]